MITEKMKHDFQCDIGAVYEASGDPLYLPDIVEWIAKHLDVQDVFPDKEIEKAAKEILDKRNAIANSPFTRSE